MNKNNYNQLALNLIKELESSPYFVWAGDVEGLSVMAYKTAEKINFGYNLGAFHVPTKQEATEMLHKLANYYKVLCRDSPEFVEYVGNRAFEAELLVMSGHMDFSVAVMRGEEIEWFSNLK